MGRTLVEKQSELNVEDFKVWRRMSVVLYKLNLSPGKPTLPHELGISPLDYLYTLKPSSRENNGTMVGIYWSAYE